MKLEFSRQILENIKISNFIKSVQWVPSCYMWTDICTDLKKLTEVYSNFVNSTETTRLITSNYKSKRTTRDFR